MLAKLPATLQLPETRTMIHEVRETRISPEDDNDDAKRGEHDNEVEEEVEKAADGDLV